MSRTSQRRTSHQQAKPLASRAQKNTPASQNNSADSSQPSQRPYHRYTPLLIFLLALLTTLYTCWAWWGKPGMLPAGHDIGARVGHTQFYFEAWHGGQWLPRWVEWIQPGLGHPLFTFYPPGYSLLSSLPMWFGISWWWSTSLAIIGLTMVGWLGMYTWVRSHGGTPTWAGVAAVIYSLAPYRLLQLIVRAALPEYMAAAILPWFLWSLHRLNTTKTTPAQLGLTAGLWALMLVTHQPTAILAGVLAGFYVLTTSSAAVFSTLFKLSSTVCLTIGLSAWFLLPLVLERPYIDPQKLTTGYYNYLLHFVSLPQVLYSPWGYELSTKGSADQLSFGLGLLVWVALAAALCTALLGKTLQHHTRKQVTALAWLTVLLSGLGIWLALPWSVSWWQRISLLAYFQYPWRWLIIPTLFGSWWWGVGGTYLEQQLRESTWSTTAKNACATLVILILCAGLIPSWWQRFPSVFLPTAQFDIATLRNQKSSQDNPGQMPETGYLPGGTLPMAPPTVFSPLILEGTGTVIPKVSLAHHHVLATNASTPLKLQFPIRWYPGWQVSINGQLVNTPKLGEWLVIPVPAGMHTVELHYQAGWGNMVGWLVTVGTGFGLIIVHKLSRHPLIKQ